MSTLDKWTAVPGHDPDDKRRRVFTRPQPGTFGRVIRDARMNLDISQSALAERAGITHSYVSRIESNDRAVDKLSTLLALANALELGKTQTLELLWAAATREGEA